MPGAAGVPGVPGAPGAPGMDGAPAALGRSAPHSEHTVSNTLQSAPHAGHLTAPSTVAGLKHMFFSLLSLHHAVENETILRSPNHAAKTCFVV